MKLRKAVVVAAALAAAACSSEKCPTETPGVNTVSASCTVLSGSTVNYPIKLCPTCNLTNVTCEVDLSAVGQGQIFLDPKAEACSDSSSCPPSCSFSNDTCAFTAPAVGNYTVTAYDPGTGTYKTGQLNVVPSGSPSCTAI